MIQSRANFDFFTEYKHEYIQKVKISNIHIRISNIWRQIFRYPIIFEYSPYTGMIWGRLKKIRCLEPNQIKYKRGKQI
jgi:hypothetical protein